jgi:hypothetical protein
MMSFVAGPVLKLASVTGSITGPQNNWNVVSGVDACVVKIRNDADPPAGGNIRGIANGQHGMVLFLVLVAGADVNINNGHSSGTSGSRIYCYEGAQQTLQLNRAICLMYDANFLGVGAWVQLGVVS